MRSLIEIFKLLQSLSRKTDKMKVMQSEKDNEEFVETLRWLLDPLITTGISDKKLTKVINFKEEPVVVSSWMELMDYLKNNNTGRDEDILVAQRFLGTVSSEDRPYYELLITKRLRLGVDTRFANYVYGRNFIPMFCVQLASKFLTHENALDGKSFTITEKLDGFRLATIIKNGEIHFFSRQGKEVEGLVEIEKDLQRLCKKLKLDNIFFDGELVAINCEEIPSDENYKIVTKTARSNGEKTGLKYDIFDTLPADEFEEHHCSMEYSERRALLNSYSEAIEGLRGYKHIYFLPVLYNGDEPSRVYDMLDWATKHNKEGVMINIDSGKYEFKRTNVLLKCKVMQDCDAKIVDVYPGEGRYKNKLGGVIVEFLYRDKYYRCECGSGFTYKERCEYWERPELIIDKIATIQYFEITKNADGGYGLRFPVWKHRIRYDKTEISME